MGSRVTLQKRIEGIFNDWRPILGLEGWNITLRFDEKKLKGYCSTSPKYLEATLGFNLERIRKETKTPEALEVLVVHEMVHIVHPRSSETAVSQTTFSYLRLRYPGRV